MFGLQSLYFSRGCALGLVLAVPVLAAGPAGSIPNPYPYGQTGPMPGSSLLFPAAGVICDPGPQLCYDTNGPSLALTRTYYGAFAAQNAQQAMAGRPSMRRFNLSNGTTCDGQRATCWNTINGQRMINRQLTAQLYGGGPNPAPYPSPNPAPYPTPYPSPYPNPSPNPSPNPTPGSVGYTGLCQLSRSGQSVFNGPCQLNEVRQGYKPRFEVNLRNGPSYVFEQTGNGYVISDGMGGSWPVQFSDNGRSGQFRWAEMSLTATQQDYRPNGNPNMGRALGNFLIDLFN